MDLRDVPLVGRVVALGAFVVDLFAMGGDALFSTAALVMGTAFGNPEMLLPVVSDGRRALRTLGFSPPAFTDTFLGVLVVALFVASVGKLILRITHKA